MDKREILARFKRLADEEIPCNDEFLNEQGELINYGPGRELCTCVGCKFRRKITDLINAIAREEMMGSTMYDDRLLPLLRPGDNQLTHPELLEQLLKRCVAEKDKCEEGTTEFLKWMDVEQGLKLSQKGMSRNLMTSTPGWIEHETSDATLLFQFRDATMTIFPDGSWRCSMSQGLILGEGSVNNLEQFLRDFAAADPL